MSNTTAPRMNQPRASFTTMLGDEMRCLNCGQAYRMNLPASVGIVAAAMQAFADEHEDCEPSDAGADRMKFSTPDEWLRSWDTGESSKTIHGVMTGRKYHRPRIPHDPSDFGRCYRLLKAFPRWRAEISKMAEQYPKQWGDLVKHWDRLEALYEEELPSGQCPKLYELLQKCAPARDG